jgi:hypothetical protein
MNRRDFLSHSFGAAAASLATSARMGASNSQAVSTPPTVHVSAKNGRTGNTGTKDAPFRTILAASTYVNALTRPGATIVIDEGTYSLDESVRFTSGPGYTEQARLTIRAASLPDDPDWHPGRMPTLINTMPIPPTWQGRPDRFGGAAEGLLVETSHVTIQGLKILGMPIVEHPQPDRIYRVYPIARYDRTLDDLLVTQCLFAGDEVTAPQHLSLLVNGNRLVVDHCLFYGVKQTVVFWTPGSTGHAMRHCLALNSYATGVWTSGIASDFEFRNNVIANGNYVWIGQGARSANAEIATPPQPPPQPPPPGGRPGDAGPGRREAGESVGRYRVVGSLFAGNKKFTGTGGGPALNFRDNDPSFLELVDTVRTEQAIAVEMDQSKRTYLHAVAGSDAAKYKAGLFKA